MGDGPPGSPRRIRLARQPRGQLGTGKPADALAAGKAPGGGPRPETAAGDTAELLRRSAKRRLSRPSRRSGQKVAFFVDHYANYHDPQLAEAFVAVLEHNGVEVYVHPEQRQAGMAAIACGALDYARKLVQHNVAIFSEAVRQGYHVVATEPAAVLCLTREYPQLIDDDEVRLVAAHQRGLRLFVEASHAGQTPARFASCEHRPGTPHALPPEGLAGGNAGREICSR